MDLKVRSLCTYLLLSSSILLVSAKKELKLLHVLSANKFYVPDYNFSSTVFETPNNLTYKYFIQNAVDMPNSAKMHLFNLGVHLRNMYGNFIGSVYMDEIIQMQTTEFPASIIAGELINAGLWPPVEPQIWKADLAWQPIPFVYTPAEEDTLLLGTLCPNFEYETQNVLKKHYNATVEHKKLLNYINEEGHIEVNNPINVSLLYLALENSIELKQISPDWAKKIYPGKNLLNITLAAYELLSKTTVQKRLNGGTFIKRVIKDSRDHIKGLLSSERKINVYSGDERNLAGVFANLNILQYQLPDPGAALIFELFAEDDNYFIKMNYYTGSSNETIPTVLIGCELFCPIDKFSDLVADYLPENELSLCGSMINKKPNSETGGSSSNVIHISETLLTVLSVGIVYLTSKI